MGRSGYKKKGAFGTMKENTPARKSRAIDLYRYLFAIFKCFCNSSENCVKCCISIFLCTISLCCN